MAIKGDFNTFLIAKHVIQMILTDTHTHLYLEEFDSDREEMIQHAIDAGVARFFLPNIDSASVVKVFALAEKYPDNCFPMMGLHPCSVKEDYEKELEMLYKACTTNKIYAIGEIGIDLYWDKTNLDEQKIAFKKQINWAKEMNLPIVIHCREAFEEIYEILLEEKSSTLRGVFHCFSGTLEQANKVIELGFYLGIGGVLTYKNSGLDKVIEHIDLKHIVLETDSPYLTPVPHRGKRNESAYVVLVAEKLAQIQQKSLKDVIHITTENSRLIFGI